MPATDSRATTRGSRRRTLEERIAEIAAGQHGVATRAQLRAAGLSASGVDRRVADGLYRRLHRGVYGIGPILPPRARIMSAALACGPSAVISHSTAGALLGLTADAGEIELSIPVPHHRSRPGLRVHRVLSLDSDERTVIDRIPVTMPARTIADLASRLDARDLERVIARAEREGMVRSQEIDALRQRHWRRPGAARLHHVIGRAGGPRLTRSEAERRFLGLVRRARLPAPQTNARLDGLEIDFLWPDHNLAVEVDGFRYHASRASFENDRRRGARLAALGIQVISLTWRQVVDDEIATAAQVAQALALRR